MLHNAILALGCALYRGTQVEPFQDVNASSAALVNHPFVPPVLLPYDEEGITSADLASRAFYGTATGYLEAEAERPMLSTVRGLLLIARLVVLSDVVVRVGTHEKDGSFNSSNSRPNIGYIYVSLALRSASVLGLSTFFLLRAQMKTVLISRLR
jgi:hypothetical protein